MKDKNKDQLINITPDNSEVLRANEDRFRSLVETTSDWIWEVDNNGVYTYVSPKIRDILGYEPEEVLGKTPFDLMPPDEAKRVADIFRSIIAYKKPFKELENINVHKDGHMITMETSGNPFFDKSGQLCGYRGIDRDITGCKCLEEKLKISEEKYRLLFATEKDAIIIIDAESRRIVDANDSALQLYGYGKKEIFGLTGSDLSSEPEKSDAAISEIARSTDKRFYFHIRNHKKKDGTIFPVEISSGTFMVQDSRMISAAIRDITERKNAENKLKESEEKLKNIFETANDAIFLLDMEGHFIDVNATAYKRLGYTREEMLSMHITQIDTPEFAARVPERLETIKAHDKAVFESAHVRKDGTVMPVEVNATLISLGGKSMFLSVIRDITYRKYLEEKYRSLVDFTTDSIYLVDMNYKYLFINKAHLLRLGLSEDQYINRAYSDFHSPEETGLFILKADNVFRTDSSTQYEYRSFRDGKYFLQTFSPVRNANNETTAITVISKDINMLKQSEEKLYSMSITDELTGLYNRRGFLALCEQQLKLANRDKRGRFLVSADIDYLKIINDNLGHKAGDLALIETAVILKESFRDSDIIGRIGGDEFEIMVIESSETGIETLISRLKVNLGTHNNQTKRTYELSLSIGTAFYNPEHPCTIDELLSKADKLMYEEKKKRKP